MRPRFAGRFSAASALREWHELAGVTYGVFHELSEEEPLPGKARGERVILQP